MSLLYGDKNGQSRQVFGPYGVVSLTSKAYLMAEGALQQRASEWGVFDSTRLGYEWVQGFHTYLFQEFGRPQFSNARSLTEAYGAGIQFFPRPHLELLLSWQKQKVARQSLDFSDYGYMMFHFYL